DEQKRIREEMQKMYLNCYGVQDTSSIRNHIGYLLSGMSCLDDKGKAKALTLFSRHEELEGKMAAMDKLMTALRGAGIDVYGE
ncbi:MAG: hypothetical protein FWF44_05480, partial [Defluviitaleaceae bacterium]|nr:hypothetical protein [Defluviitaleaceae bacterium]